MNKPKHGGTRPGSGKPRQFKDVLSEMIWTRVTKDQKYVYNAINGAHVLRELLQKEIDPKMPAEYEFNYDLQVYTKDGIIENCGHKVEHECDCNARLYQGMTIEQAKKEISNADK